MKVAFLFGAWSIGSRPLNFYGNNINISTRGLTGSELGVITTAQEFVKSGHDVSLFTVHVPNTKPDIWNSIILYNIEESSTIINDDFDAIISWSEPDILRGLPQKPVRVVCQMLNDFTYCQQGFDDCVDVWTAPCQMLIDHLKKQSNCPPSDKWNIVPLGCEPSWYEDNKKVPGRIVWTSSADRGLHWLLQEYPKIKTAVPYASLRIFYNFNYDSTEGMEPDSNNHPHFLEMGNRARYMKESIKRLKHLDVQHIGSVSREQINHELSQAMVLGYPCDPVAFTEGFSVSILEACAADVVPVISSADCLESIYGGTVPMIKTPVQENLNEFSDFVIKGLTDDIWRSEVINKCKEFANQHTWEKSAKKLEKVIHQHPKYIK